MEGVYHIKGTYVCPTASLVWLSWRRVGTAQESHECKEQADTCRGEPGSGQRTGWKGEADPGHRTGTSFRPSACTVGWIPPRKARTARCYLALPK